MFKRHKWWSVLLFAGVSIVLGLRLLTPFLIFCLEKYIEKNSAAAMQAYEWAIEPQNVKIEYRRHGFDVCTEKNDNGTATMYLKDADGNIVTSRVFEAYRTGYLNGLLRMDEYGIVYIENFRGNSDKQISYAGIIPLDDMPRTTFQNANPDAPFCLQYIDNHDDYKSNPRGYVNRQGFWVIPPKDYEQASQFSDGYAVVRGTGDDGTSSLYILNQDGTLSPCGEWSRRMRISSSDFGAEIADGMFMLEGDNGYYFLNVAENSIFPDGKGYEKARGFSDGLAAVKENGLWGYVDKTGQYILPPRYLETFGFSNGYAYVIDQNGQPLVIDRTGEVISSKIGTDTGAGGYADGFFRVVANGKYNLVDLKGKQYLPKDGVEWLAYQNGVWLTIPLSYHKGVFLPQCRKYIAGDAVYVYETAVIVNSENKSTLYDKATGKVLYRCKEISRFYEGLAVAKNGRRQTFIDTQGRELFAPQVVQLGNFSDGLASVTLLNGTSGMIANPLIYDAWTADENARATALGIEPIPAEFLNYEDLWPRLAVVSNCVYETRTRFQTEDAVSYQVDVGAIRSALEREGYPSEGVVDREHLAVALKALAAEYGIVTDGFLMFYDDKDEVTDSCESAMAYLSTLCLFDMEGTSILPQKQVSASEGQAYLLRFFERMIDQTQNPFFG